MIITTISPMRNDNGGIVPPWLQYPIELPIMPPGYEEPKDTDAILSVKLIRWM